MKVMLNHSSARHHAETPHVSQTTRTTTTINALTRRVQSVLNDKSIDVQSRALIRYALEINDPSLGELVRRVDAGEAVIDMDLSEIAEDSEDHLREEKIEVLTELICRAGDEPETKSAALLVLMATLENATHPKVLANAAKHFAFSRCGELNVCGMVDSQIAVLESELLV
jgi:hypothetical protein